jgi:hypothetical protein
VSKPEHLDPKKRAAEKAASRRADEQALASGAKSREELRRENALLGSVKARPKYSKAKSLS